MLAPITEMYWIIFCKSTGLPRFPILPGKRSQNKSRLSTSGVCWGLSWADGMSIRELWLRGHVRMMSDFCSVSSIRKRGNKSHEPQGSCRWPLQFHCFLPKTPRFANKLLKLETLMCPCTLGISTGMKKGHPSLKGNRYTEPSLVFKGEEHTRIITQGRILLAFKMDINGQKRTLVLWTVWIAGVLLLPYIVFYCFFFRSSSSLGFRAAASAEGSTYARYWNREPET